MVGRSNERAGGDSEDGRGSSCIGDAKEGGGDIERVGDSDEWLIQMTVIVEMICIE
jgi:hypothetical protein